MFLSPDSPFLDFMQIKSVCGLLVLTSFTYHTFKIIHATAKSSSSFLFIAHETGHCGDTAHHIQSQLMDN